MKTASRLAWLLGVLSLSGLLSACGEKAGEQPSEQARLQGATDQMVIAGAGATFPAPLYQRWILDYSRVRPDLTFTYEPVGSGEGVKRFLAGTVDFGASDAALNDKELAQVDPGSGAVMVPTTAGMVVLAYHIPGVAEGLRLARDVYVDIFAGRIKVWDHPRITATNPGLQLPSKPIIPVVRRDSSGTTFAMTNHLASVDPNWKTSGPGVGKQVDWPGSAMTAPGNEGVAQRIKITDGSIGYVEYEFAERLGLPIATLQNRAGEWILASPAAGQAALASVTDIPADLRVFVPDPEGTDAYPITSYTWILLKERYQDPAKATALKDALGWGLSEGQTVARELGYVPLPQTMLAMARDALARVH